MSFTTILFLFLFLPLTLGVYYLVPEKLKNLMLLLFSILFYTWGDKIYVLVLGYSVAANFICGRLMDDGKRKLGLTLSLLVNLLLLGFFKYYNFACDSFHEFLDLLHLKSSFLETIPDLAIPLGISFYTFKSVSYAVDVYRSKVKASRSFIDFATYIIMFPPFVAGPIVRYSDIRSQLVKKNISYSGFESGIERFIIGLAKKVILANTFASVADSVFGAQVSELGTLMAWTGVIAYTFQIYYDFSGYSDMAIGLGKMFGFDFPENFNYPYISRNIREFWRRWHISLSMWLRDYIFLPLAYAFSRRLRKDMYLGLRTDIILYIPAIFVTFLVCGIWHGSAWNFVLWGLWFALFMAIEQTWTGRLLKRSWPPLQYVYTLLVITVGWVIFRAESVTHAGYYFLKLFSFSQGNSSFNSYLKFFAFNREVLFLTVPAVMFSAPFSKLVRRKASAMALSHPYLRIYLAAARIITLAVLFIVSVSYIVSGTFNAFIYARF